VDALALRALALRAAGSCSGAARLVGISHVSLGQWIKHHFSDDLIQHLRGGD
jgi:DNA-binding transcriptional regulator YdaS (Cro superfamily)